eukprot:COSAG06_NODE_243_length_19221_cov_15.057578_11_plen_54_part_00
MEISGDLRPLYAKYVRTPCYCYDMTTLQTGMADGPHPAPLPLLDNAGTETQPR